MGNPLLRFAYQLAGHLKIIDPVNAILGKLDNRQLATWMAFLDMEPLAADRADVRSGFHTALIANRLDNLASCILMQPLDGEPLQPSELIIDWQKASEPAKTVDPVIEADALVLAINARFRT